MSSRTICVFAESQPREGVKGQERAPMRKRHADVRVDSGAAACSRHPHEPGRTARRALPVPARDCRRRSCFPAVRPADPNRTGTGAGAVRGAGPSRRGIRHLAARFASLAVIAGVLTTAAVAFLGWRFAGLPIAAAIALGAIVAPPDAVAANEVMRHLRIPQRIGLVLQGESLLNDATALLIYRAAVASAVGSFSLVGDAPILLLAAVGSLVAGYVMARLYMVATPYVRDAAGSTVLQFISTFGVWLLSERLTLSPIITVMVYAMTLAQAASGRLGPRLRC